MSEHSCCYKCPKRAAGCGVGCSDFEKERAKRRAKKPDPNKIYAGYRHEQHLKIARCVHHHRSAKIGRGFTND